MISRVTSCYYSKSLDSELNLWWSISSLMLSSTGRKTIDMIMVNYDSIYFLANQQFEGFNHDSKLGTEIFALEQCLLFRDPGVYSFSEQEDSSQNSYKYREHTWVFRHPTFETRFFNTTAFWMKSYLLWETILLTRIALDKRASKFQTNFC